MGVSNKTQHSIIAMATREDYLYAFNMNQSLFLQSMFKKLIRRGPDDDSRTKLCSPECLWCLFGASVIRTCIFS